MTAKRIERAAALFAVVSLTAMVAAFAIGQVRAQPVNAPPPPPPPVFNPSGPGTTVPQPPPVPVSPGLPSGPSSSAPAPVSPDITTPPVVSPPPPPAVTPPPPISPPPSVTPPPAVAPQAATAPAEEKPALSPTHARYHGPMRRWSRHRGRFHPRVLGPSYYPGLGEFYPPYPDPCHFRRVWQGYYAPYWTYACGW